MRGTEARQAISNKITSNTVLQLYSAIAYSHAVVNSHAAATYNHIVAYVININKNSVVVRRKPDAFAAASRGRRVV